MPRKRKITLPRKITMNLAYLCGILAGDGSMGFRPLKHEYRIKCVGNPKDEKGLYRKVISPRFEEVFGFSPVMRLQDSGKTFGFVIYSRILYYYLHGKIGLPTGRKYAKLKIPQPMRSDKKS